MPAAPQPKDTPDAAVWEREGRILRRWGWLFPLFGVAAGLWWGCCGWAALVLDPSLHASLASAAGRKSTWLAAGLIAAWPVAWAAGLRLTRRCGGRVPFLVVLALALPALVALDLAVRTPSAQSLLWNAVRVRAGGNYFMREVSYLRLHVAAARSQGEPPGGTVLAGSSQMLHAADPVAIARGTGRPVYRRAVAGMFALEACAAQEHLQVRGAREVVLFCSGLDFGAHRGLQANWMRPLCSWRGVIDVAAALEPAYRWRAWRSWVDLGLASGSELWASRDYLRHCLLSPWGPVPSSVPASPHGPELLTGAEAGPANPDAAAFAAAGQRAFETLLRRLSASGNRLVILEGGIDPARATASSRALDEEARQLVRRLARELPIRYIERGQQAAPPGEADWLDMLHVNAAGREKVTASIVAAVAAEPSP